MCQTRVRWHRRSGNSHDFLVVAPFGTRVSGIRYMLALPFFHKPALAPTEAPAQYNLLQYNARTVGWGDGAVPKGSILRAVVLPHSSSESVISSQERWKMHMRPHVYACACFRHWPYRHYSRGRTDKTPKLKINAEINCFLLEPFDVVYTSIIYYYLVFFSTWTAPILASKLRFLWFLLFLVVFTSKTGNW